MAALPHPLSMNFRPSAPDMKLFSTARSKRHTAVAVLLVWLFALASGVANACLLEVPGLHADEATQALSQTAHAAGEWVGHGGPVANHHGESDTSKASCLKVCGDGSQTLRNAHSGVDQTGLGPAPLVATLSWSASAQLSSVPRRLGELQPPVVGPPFRVRYSRLAL